MARQSNLRNDRDAVIAVVAEHVVADDKQLRRAAICPMNERPAGVKIIEHNSNWIFSYDNRTNSIYVSF